MMVVILFPSWFAEISSVDAVGSFLFIARFFKSLTHCCIGAEAVCGKTTRPEVLQ